MSSDGFDDDDHYEPKRDERGRYVKGSTGNRDGRPPKRPKAPKSWGKCLADAWEAEVAVNDNGTSQLLTMKEVVARSIVRAAVKAKPKDMLQIGDKLERLVAAVAEEEPEEEVFTEEDRRMLERIRREVIPHICCQCEKPVYRAYDEHPRRDDFRFE